MDGRLAGFAVVEQAYDRPMAQHEAARCLSCDLLAFDVDVNAAVCKECGYCQEVCGPGVFEKSGQFNASGYLPVAATGAERCIGCLRCLYICPDFAITITDRRAQ
jgi:NAD-dependent dihydropyrimidine dehydrogenase PreA subunit